MSAQADLAHCEEAIRHGSLSFHAASKVLPKDVRQAALALYAFCRLADDAVDLNTEKAQAVLRLEERLARVYEGRPLDQPTDRAFARIVEDYEMPRALPDALLEGLAWDAMGRTYDTLSDVYGYSARVAAAVGVMMCVLMRVRDAHALARACDLGVAMQLTNIARDVGEDAHERRLYLPKAWMDEAGIDLDAFYDAPAPTADVRAMVSRLVSDARRLYFRSEAGIAGLPLSCRPGIWAARLIYAGIAGQVKRQRYDTISRRARTSKLQKIGWLAQANTRAVASSIMPHSAVIYAPVLPECSFLVDAAAQGAPERNRADALVDALAALKRHQQLSLMPPGMRSS
ncbi:15-cis-phytoene synthase [Primorskyibacter sp. S187A]|uniref:15-cis-phytoene synthase n=1 Tax=Primorskyibacter sp. S187A TaxID=3415130 RepID=UPI003C7E3E33